MAGKVREVGTDRGLPPKMRVFDRQVSQMPPELPLGFGHVATQSARSRHTPIKFAWLFHHEAPTPSPSPPLARARGGRGAAPPCAPYIERKAARVTSVALKKSPVHLADLAHRVLDPLGVGVPERLELGLVEIGEVLAEILERVGERLALCCLFDVVA